MLDNWNYLLKSSNLTSRCWGLIEVNQPNYDSSGLSKNVLESTIIDKIYFRMGLESSSNLNRDSNQEI